MSQIATSERGASAILVAMSMIVLMGFAAIAIDYGMGVNERRLDQNTADTAVMSAGVELIVSGDVQTAVDTVLAFTDENLDRTVPLADWASCTDPGALAVPSDTIPGIVNGSNCISFGPNDDGVAFGKIRVRIPDQTTEPAFARILGVAGLITDAFAESQLDGFGQSGAFPAAVFAPALTGDSFCIKTGTGSANQDSCGEPSTGDFGNFQPYFYTELSPGNPSTLCRSGNQTAPLSRAMADGIDHFLGTTPSAPGNRINGDNCPQFPGPLFPNRVDSGSGYSNSDITDGLIAGGNYDGSYDGRLTRQTWGAPYGSASIFGEAIDNRPLWSYIDTSVIDSFNYPDCWAASNGPNSHNDSTNPGQEGQYIQAQTDMDACLTTNPPASLFVDDLYQSPRLTIVPKYHQSSPIGNNSCCYDIQSFVPVFIEGVWTNTGPQWTCDGGVVEDSANGFCKHEPGRTGQISIGPAGQQKVDSASATVLSCEILPGVDPPAEKCKKVETGAGTIDVFLNLYLTR